MAEKSELSVQIAEANGKRLKQQTKKYIIFSLQRLGKKEDKNDNFQQVLLKLAQKIFVTAGGLIDGKYSLINRKLYQKIVIINLNEINNWNEIKKKSSLLSLVVNFQAQGNNRDTKHFSYNFIRKNTGDVLNFLPKLE